MRRIRIPIFISILVTIVLVISVTETRAQTQAQTSFGYQPRKSLIVNLKGVDLWRKMLIWEIENKSDKIAETPWLIINNQTIFIKTFEPNEVRTVETPVGELLEIFYYDGSFMTSVEVPALICLFL